VLHLSRNELLNALRDLDEAIRIKPSYPAALAARAEVYRRQGRTSDALADVDKAIELDRGLTYAHNVRAAIHADTKRLEQQKAASQQADADHQLCKNAAAEIKARGEACDRVIRLGKLSGVELANAYFARAWMKHQNNQVDEAIADYAEVLRHNPGEAGAFHNRGVLYLSKNDLPKALRDLDEAIRIKTNYPAALAARAEVHRREGRLTVALADANQAIELDQGLTYAHNVRAAIQADIKRLEQQKAASQQADADRHLCKNASAEVKARGEACDRLIKRNTLVGKDLAEAHFGRAYMWHREGQVGPAILDYSEVVRLDPDHFFAHHNRGKLHLDGDNLEQAVKDFSEALRITPKSASALSHRAEAYRRLGRLQEAAADVDKALEIDRAYEFALRVRDAIRRTRAQTLRAKKDYAAAIAAWTELIDQGSKDPSDFNHRGAAYSAIGDDQRAMDDYTRAIGLNGHDWRPHYGRAFIHGKRGDVQAALNDLNAAIRDHHAKDYATFLMRGRAHVIQENHPSAIDDFNKAVELAPPGKPDAYYWRGRTQAAMVFAAIDACRTPGSLQSRTMGGNCSRPPDFEAALADLRVALSINLKHAEAHFEIGRIMMEQGDRERALQAYSAAIAANPNHSMAHNNRGAAHAALGRSSPAFADYNRAIALDQGNKHAWASRAYWFEQRGQRQDAIRDYRKALEIDANFPPARDGLRRLGM
jgi:tetratricopeptide (TPR) repeat protein